jgi:hypothetical protein
MNLQLFWCWIRDVFDELLGEMDGDVRRFVWANDGEEGFDREVRWTLARVGCGLLNESDSVLGRPVACCGLEVEDDDSSAKGSAVVGPVKHDHRSGYERSGRVSHVAETVEMAFHGEEFFGVQMWGCAEIVA